MTRTLIILFLGFAACSKADTDETDTTDTTDTDVAESYSLTLNGTEYTPHSDGGHSVRATLFDASGAEIDTKEVPVVAGEFTVSWPDALTSGDSYKLLWYADMNGDDACQDPNVDHVWRRDMAAVAQDQVIDHVHSAADFALCN